MPNKSQVDTTPRYCSCGTVFSMVDYPKGYFRYKKQVRKGSIMNVCPKCEAGILQRMLEAKASRIREEVDRILIGNQCFWSAAKEPWQSSMIRLRQDIELLCGGKPANDAHLSNIIRVYGE